MSRPASTLRFSFQAKVLAPVLAFLVLLPTVTLWIINRQIGQQALSEARETLATADAVFRNSLDILNRGLATRFRGVANEPRFKAVASTGDANTMTDFLRSLLEEFGTEIEFVTYSLQPGTMLAGARHEAHVDFETFLRATKGLSLDAFDGDVSTGTIFAAGRPYSVVSVPVPSSDRLSIAGVLTIGLYFGNHSLQELKSLTRTDIAVISAGQVAATTLANDLLIDSTESQAAVLGFTAQRVMPLEVKGEHFLAFAGDYVAAAGRPGFHYLLLSSYEARLQALRHTQWMLAGLSLVGILVSGGSVWFLIRRITQPLRALRDSAEAVGRGDFTQRIERFSNDECGELAGTFNSMTSNLLTSRNELERTVDTLRATDARLRESEEELRLTIESARDHMICTLDSNGHVQRWNAAAERLLGYTAAQAQDLSYASFFAPDQCSAGVPERLLAMAASTGREAFEGWRVRRDGTRFWADVTLSRLPENAGFVEIARDSTLRKEAEEALLKARDAAESANRAKTEFIANMSHELRTPMNAIIGMSSLLLDDALPSETRDGVQTIRTSADSLLEIIDDILDVSRIEAGRIDLKAQAFDICGAIDDIVDLFAARCSARNIDLAVHLAHDLPAVILGDSVRLRQVLSNLVANAIKFTERGGVTISVSHDKSSAGEERLQISVEDTGIGIPASRMDRLFKMFSQVDTSTTRRFGGTGLGLVIGRKLIELMGGTIGVESEPGRGSRFYFTIRAPSEPPRSPSEFAGLSAKRVLIVGPETIATKGIARQLTTWGAVVTSAPALPASGAPFEVVLLADGVNIEATDAAHGLPLTLIRLKRLSENRGDPVVPSRLTVSIPVKPRILHAAIRKALETASRPSPAIAKAPAFGADFAQRHPLRVLLVEDNPVNAQVAQLLLKRLGYVADWAVNGRKGLDCIRRQTYDLVLMDLQMPEMDGLDATRALLSIVPLSQLPYIVALTANVRQDDRDACAAAGMHDFLSKPVKLETLATGIERAHGWVVARSNGSPPVGTPAKV